MRPKELLTRGGDERGITLVELLVALALFAIVAIGTLGALGATNAGGFLEGFPVAFSTTRSAKDITAAAVYIQSLHEHLAQQGGLTEGVFTFTPASPDPFGFVKPSAERFQLRWTQMQVEIQRWGWNGEKDAYQNGEPCTTDCLFWVRTQLEWQLKDSTRSVAMERFIRP